MFRHVSPLTGSAVKGLGGIIGHVVFAISTFMMITTLVAIYQRRDLLYSLGVRFDLFIPQVLDFNSYYKICVFRFIIRGGQHFHFHSPTLLSLLVYTCEVDYFIFSNHH